MPALMGSSPHGSLPVRRVTMTARPSGDLAGWEDTVSITTHRSARPGLGRVARFRLDVGEWLVLREALCAEAPGRTTPASFDPVAFGLPATGALGADERHRAVDMLYQRKLVLGTEVRLHPAVLLGLRLLLEPQVRIEVSSWSGSTALTQAVAWGAGRTTALARRCRATSAHGADVAEQEGAVELTLCGGGGLIDEVMRALPPSPPAAVPGEAVEVGWRESAAVVHALRTGRADVAAHLSGLPDRALELLGAASRLTGGASIIGATGHPRVGTLGVHGVWLWTENDLIELVGATSDSVTLRRSTAARLRRSLLAAVTGLLHPAGAA